VGKPSPRLPANPTGHLGSLAAVVLSALFRMQVLADARAVISRKTVLAKVMNDGSFKQNPIVTMQHA
jgi:hypothetical protein